MKKPEGALIMIGMEKPAGSGASEMCVPTHALAVDGTEPSEGDTVEFSVKGTVKRAENGKTYVQPDTINGEPVAAPEEKPEDMSDDDMMDAAKKADEES